MKKLLKMCANYSTSENGNFPVPIVKPKGFAKIKIFLDKYSSQCAIKGVLYQTN